MTSCSTVSINFMQGPNTEIKTPEHKTLNNALVTTNKVISITWKLSINHASLTYITQKYVRIARPFYLRDRNWKINTPERHCGTSSWVYKPSDLPTMIGGGNPCWSYRSQNLHPTKTVQDTKMPFPPPKLSKFFRNSPCQSYQSSKCMLIPMPGTGLMVPSSPSSA